MLRRWKISTATLALAASLALPGGAEAAWPPSWSKATVKSVDGPGILTLDHKGRDLPIRLFFIDTPRTGECGAAQATSALNGFVRRAPRQVRFAIAHRLEPRAQAQDADGRYLAMVTYTVRGKPRGFGSDLLRAEWARAGEPATVDGARVGTADLTDGEHGHDEPVLPAEPRARRGVWALCGGRLHLPIGETPGASAPAAWSVSEQGIASAVGPLALSPSLTPTGSLTFRQLSTIAPTEFARWPGGCRAWVPSLQIRSWAYVDEGKPCGDAVVSALSTVGPEAASLTRGGAVGTPAASLKAYFPLLAPTDGSLYWRLSGPGRRVWAWQAEAEVDRAGTLKRLAAYASPRPPQR